MQYRNLGSSGVKVSSLCLGAMTFGEANAESFMHQVGCDEATSFDILNAALTAGVNFIDTADVYGQDGLSERIIGKWFTQQRKRNDVVLASKFRFTMGGGANASGASRYRIIRCVEDSLRRLQTDRIDLYQIHMQDIDTPEEETLRALDDLVRAGKVLYIGASNYAAYRLADSAWLSRSHNLHHFVTLQAQYSLVVRELEREHIPACQRFGLGVLPWSPLAGGFLSGKYSQKEQAPKGSRLHKWEERFAQYATDRNWAVVETLKKIAAASGHTPAAVAMAWLLQKACVSSVIFGARSVQQLNDNLQAAEIALSADAVAQLDAASAPKWSYPYDFLGGRQGRW